MTFSSNLLLNTTKQLIAALLSLGGNVNAAPAEAQLAIADAQAGIDVHPQREPDPDHDDRTQDQLSALTATLTSFNQGEFSGFPSCEG